MRQLAVKLFLVSALFLSGAGFLAAQEGDGEPVEIREQTYEYAGTRECRDCHRDTTIAHRDTAHALTLVELEADMEPEENPVIADFEAGEDTRTVSFPDDETRPFTAEDAAYVLGAGVHAQAFVYEAEDGFYVFPAEWRVAEETWIALELGDEWPSESYAFGPNCAGCHAQGLDIESYTWEEDGVMCESCHGPGLDHVEAADDAGGSIDEAERAEIYALINLGLDSATCGSCHARGLSADGTHPFPTDHFPGQDLDAAFSLVDPSDEAIFYSSGHAQLSYMQYNEALTSAHPGSLAGLQENVEDFPAECLTCHSAAQQRLDMLLANDDIDPETVTVEGVLANFPVGVTCASCHDPHMEREEGVPPRASGLRVESDQLCESCHADSDITEGLHYPTVDLFQGATFIEQVEAVPSAHFTAEDGPTCTTCHMPTIETPRGARSSHTFHIVEPGAALDIETLEDSCSGCHEESPAALQDLIDVLQASTQGRIEAARATTSEESPDWITTALDAVEGDGSAGIHNYAYTDALLDAVELELDLLSEEAES